MKIPNTLIQVNNLLEELERLDSEDKLEVKVSSRHSQSIYNIINPKQCGMAIVTINNIYATVEYVKFEPYTTLGEEAIWTLTSGEESNILRVASELYNILMR